PVLSQSLPGKSQLNFARVVPPVAAHKHGVARGSSRPQYRRVIAGDVGGWYLYAALVDVRATVVKQGEKCPSHSGPVLTSIVQADFDLGCKAGSHRRDL